MFSPPEVAERYREIGRVKVGMKTGKGLVLAALAGMFIALAAAGANTASSTVADPSFAKLLGALVFPTGLVMVLLAGSELFTGNTLLVIPLLCGEIKVSAMLRNWLLVFTGNLAGALLVALICRLGGQWNLFGGVLAVTTIKVAAAKCGLGFGPALWLGIGCNFLVCIAVWISFSAQTVGGKVAGLFLPIMLFVLAGFEHSVANMYYIPAGLLAAAVPEYAAAARAAGVDLSALTWGRFFLANLLPVTIGNIIGGSALVGLPYWYAYLRK